MRTVILGISAFYHDSAAALVIDGEVIAAAQEERFTRRKNDSDFPTHAIRYVLSESGIDYDELTAVVFYDKPLLKFERLLETFHAFAPRGLFSFLTAVPVWIKQKLFMRRLIRRSLKVFGERDVTLLFSEHHLSHAASAFYPGPFEEAAILTIDGVGEWATTTICHGSGQGIKVLKELHFPHSIGLLYASFTYYLGFKVNSGEYKLMGLSPYGDAKSERTATYKRKILSDLVDVREDGSILLNMRYFNFATGATMTVDAHWQELFDLPRRLPETEFLPLHADLAAAIQQVIELIVLKLVRTAKDLTGSVNLVMAGGVALNCVCNARIGESEIFESVWIQPAAGDAGGALGAALACTHIAFGGERQLPEEGDSMKHCYLGPEYGDADIVRVANKFSAYYTHYEDFGELTAIISRRIADGNIIGWFQGRMEFGPRALGNRSILADPRNADMQRRLNIGVKSREEFRPFAPAVLEEDAGLFFTSAASTPYMLFVRFMRPECRRSMMDATASSDVLQRLYQVRSAVPCVTHVDYSARVQTVSSASNLKLWKLLQDFKKISGIGMLVNTSFNVRGEPMVCTPYDAYIDFMNTEMDFLVIGNYVFDKRAQLHGQAQIVGDRFERD
ncbi:MAG TPA: carbamoyltransferase N-terminal domain-containing protein [Chryseolinea sp.]|nr:carbamoyltransferase N-terminal domain-containing protein [Chryseolinea sp.]